MNELLGMLDQFHWSEALNRSSNCEALRKHLISGSGNPVGPAFIYALPWDEIATVLDIGAGMGFLSAPMATFAKTIVSLEAVPERALFLKKRAKQDNIVNIHPLIASATAIPFENETFDLITLNGVFEYLGLWGDGDPKAVQQQFLERIFRLLRPNGLLYVGIETRYGLQWWRGGRDHSGLRYTSLMPRAVANVYTRLRKSPIYGGERAANGYRTYTHTPMQYKRMLQAAGFQTVEVHGCFPGYNSQAGIYSLGSPTLRTAIREIVDRPSTRTGLLRLRLINRKPLAPALEEEVLIFGRKQLSSKALLWPTEPGTEGTFGQISTVDKFLLLNVANGRSQSISKAGKTEAARQRLQKEYSLLTELEQFTQSRGATLRWPRPLVVRHLNGFDLFEYEYAKGVSASTLILNGSLQSFRDMLAKVVDGYIALSTSITNELCGKGDCCKDRLTVLSDLAASLSDVDFEDDELGGRLAGACTRLRESDCQIGFIHGDLALDNIISVKKRETILVDWERARLDGLPSIDLMRLLHDVEMHYGRARRSIGTRAISAAREIIEKGLTALGCSGADLVDMEVLFLADQVKFCQSRGIDHRKIIREYRTGAFRLFADVRVAVKSDVSQPHSAVEDSNQ